jgi:hypothetical protein
MTAPVGTVRVPVSAYVECEVTAVDGLAAGTQAVVDLHATSKRIVVEDAQGNTLATVDLTDPNAVSVDPANPAPTA